MKKIPASLGLLVLGSTLLTSCSNTQDTTSPKDSKVQTSSTIQSQKTNSFSRRANTNSEVSVEYDTRSRAS